MKDDELLHKWINREISEEELEIFKQREEYESLVELYERTEVLDYAKPDFQQMLGDILTKSEVTRKIDAKPEFQIKTFFKYLVAASVLILIGYFLLPTNNVVTYQLDGKGMLTKALLDGSKFNLNGGSKLSFDKSTWENERNLNLKGEAYFEVVKGSAFKVNTTNGNVQVLGTKFNVKARGKFIEVYCAEGRVEVVQGESKQVLNALEGVKFSPGSEPYYYTDSGGVEEAWMAGVTKLRRADLEEVISELEIQFDIEIEKGSVSISDLVNCFFTHRDLDLALKTALKPFNIEYEKQKDRKLLLKNKE